MSYVTDTLANLWGQTAFHNLEIGKLRYDSGGMCVPVSGDQTWV